MSRSERNPLGLLLGCMAATGGCTNTDGAMKSETVDVATFVQEVQPVFAKRCANPSCHGSGRRPLEVFAVHTHRLDPAHVYLDAPLTETELERNYHRASAFVLEIDRPEQSLLLLKPLARAAGGARHGGDAVFSDRESAEYQALERWIETHLTAGLE